MSVARSLRRPRFASLPTRSFHLATILEDFEQHDCPVLNLGTESLAGTPKDTSGPTMLSLAPVSRRRSLSLLTTEGRRLKQANVRKAVDRECMICFHLPQRPCRTNCCGKLFCEAHLYDWLAGSLNRCPSCSAYCHPKTDVLSLASPASPIALSQQNSFGSIRHKEHFDGDPEIPRCNIGKGSQSRCHSPSPSSSSSSSVDPNTDQDDEDKCVQAKTGIQSDSSSLRSFLVKLMRQLLDDSSLGTPEVSHVEFRYPETYPLPPASQSLPLQIFLTTSYRSSASELVDDDSEMTTVALAGKVIGKILSIVALMLVFWILAS